MAARQKPSARIFAVDLENEVHASISKDQESLVPGPVKFTTEKGLIERSANWPSSRLVEIWNSLPGVKPVGRFMDRKTAIRRIWRTIQRLEPENGKQQPTRPASAPGRANVAANADPGELANTKSDRIIALLKRPSGATLKEILAFTGWQSHSVRGFISAQLVKKKGFRVRSFTRNGERVYRIRS